jgi:hypothetical protein
MLGFGNDESELQVAKVQLLVSPANSLQLSSSFDALPWQRIYP